MVERVTFTDRQPVSGTQLEALDLTLVQRHIATAESRYSGPADPVAFLRRHNLVIDIGGELVPTLASLLAFSNEPERWLPASGIDVAQYTDNTRRTSSLKFIERVRGPLSAVVDQTSQILWTLTDHEFRFEGAQRLEINAYPRAVLRELTVNALCHRDWSNEGSRVRIEVFPNYIEWSSPGGLPSGITIENLLEAQFSRNPTIVAIMYQGKYIEGLGLGFDTVFNALAESGVEPPLIRNTSNALTIRVMSKAIGSNQRASESTPQERQKLILSLITQHGSVTISDLENRLGIIRRSIQRDLQALIEQGDILAEGATNKRRYRLRQQ